MNLKTFSLLAIFFLFIGAIPCLPAATEEGRDTDNRTNAYYEYLLAYSAYMKGESREAAAHLNRVIELDPTASYAFSLKGEIKILEGDTSAAEKLALKAIQKNDENIQAYRVLGEVYHRLYSENDLKVQYLQKSIESYRKIVEISPKDQNAHFSLGKLLYISGDFKQAVDSLKKHLEVDPNALLALLYISKIFEEWGDYGKAADYLERALEVSPDNAMILTTLADIYRVDERFERAVEKYRKALETGPQDDTVLYNLASCYQNLEDYEEAESLLEVLLETDPENINYLNDLTVLYEKTREYQKAIDTFDVLIERILGLKDKIETTAIGYLLVRRGEIYFGIQDYFNALADYKEALAYFDKKKDQESHDFVVQRMAASQLELQRANKTLSLLKNLLREHPDDPSLNILKAKALAAKGSPDQGVMILRNLLVKEETNLSLYVALSDIFEKDNRLDEVISLLGKKEKLFHENDMYFYFLGQLQEKAGKIDAAERALKKAILINPDNDQALNTLSYLYAEHDIHLDISLEMIQRALALDAFNGAYLDTLGWAYYKLDRLDEAEHTLLKAVRKIRDPVVYDHLGDVYRKIENFPQAIKYWQQAIKFKIENPEEVKRKIELTREKIASNE